MAYWLMKSEPDELSIHTLQQQGQALWDGVRNYQARNFLRAMQAGDLFFFHHASCPQPGIAGIGRILGRAFADPSALDPHSPYFDPRASEAANPWSAVEVACVDIFDPLIPLARLKACPALSELALVQRGSRLSVMPVLEAQWQAILGLRR